jgi:acyl dehydratase
MAIDPSKLLALDIPDARQTYEWRESVIYALGLGFGLDPLDERQLRFVDETRLKVVPTMANVLAYPGLWIRNLPTGIDWVRTVHGEQAMRIHRPLGPAGDVVRKTRVVEIVDKGEGRGALLYIEGRIVDANTGEPIATLLQTVFCRGDGGFGGSPTSSRVPHPVPDRSPDLSLDLPTHPQLALIYRLSGDLNPLHADPAVARKAGYHRPILHGLATYGVAGHALMAALCEYEPDRVLALEGRFSAPVFPGETITVDLWREEPGRVAFQARVVARNVVVLANGHFEYVG